MQPDRDAILTALGTVPGLAPSPTTPDVIVAGSAWPAWVSTTWLTHQSGGARDTRWFVFVALSAGEREASVAEAEPLIEQVAVALWDAGLGALVVEPMQWAVEPGGQALPVLRFSATA